MPAYLYAGVRPDVVAMPLGQGHTAFGRYAKDVGANGYQLLAAEPAAFGGVGHYAAVSLRMSIPTFAKIVTGDADGARAFFEGRIQIEGDLTVAARLSEMFGGRSNF